MMLTLRPKVQEYRFAMPSLGIFGIWIFEDRVDTKHPA